MPLVTAVMIFLNGEKYIAEAIDSIVTQTYPNWELVLVDDGSTDGATAIARDYCRRFPGRIRYIEHPAHENRGMSASRNAGVRAGHGEFVSFLDADDIWLPDRLAQFIPVAQAFPDAGMIYGPTLYWYSWAGPQDDVAPADRQEDFPGHLDLPPRTLVPPPVAMRQFLLSNGGCLPGICSLLIRRTAFDRVGGFDEAFRGLYEDQVFLSKITLTHPVVVIEEVLDHYRQHPESCCHKSLETGEYHPEDYHPARGVYLEWLDRYRASIGLADPMIERAIWRQRLPYRWPRTARAINRLLGLKRTAKGAIRRAIPLPVLRAIQRVLRWLRNAERSWRIRRVSH